MKTTAILLTLASTIAAKGCWKNLAPIGSGPRFEHGAAAIDKDIYIVGGIINDTWGVTSMEKYSTTDNKWTVSQPIPRGMHHSNVASLNGKLYVLGGMVGDGNYSAVGSAFSFDPKTEKWETLEDMPDARGAAAVGVFGNKVYIAGGAQLKGKTYSKAVSAFDTMSKKWETLPSKLYLPEEREHVGGVVVGSHLFVVGGRLNGVLKNNTWALDLSDLTSNKTKWENLETGVMKHGRGGMAVSALRETIYAFGGEGNTAPGTKGVFDNAESFDVSTKLWVEETPMKVARHGAPGTAVGNWIYIAGGGMEQGHGMTTDSLDAFGTGPC